jgi:hypothetical protein
MELWENELIVEEHELLQTGATSCVSVAEATEHSFGPLLFDQELIESPANDGIRHSLSLCDQEGNLGNSILY